MKIGLLHDSILPAAHYGGIERVVMVLARGLKKRGHDVVLFCHEGSQVDEFETCYVKKDHDVQFEWLPQDLDIYHTHQPLPVRPHIPFLTTIHGNAKPNEKFFTNTNFISQSHAKNHGAKHFVYNGIEVEDFPFQSEKENFIVFLAKASWRVKNLKTAIELANDTQTELHVLGGKGADSKFVKFHGIVGEDVKHEILPRAKALVYPTNWDEPFGFAVTEALACGTPVIASNNGSMPELISSDVGMVCKTYEEFAQALDKVNIIDPDACRRRVKEYFSADAMVEGYLKLYQEIIEKGKLQHSPHYNFNKESVNYIFKPTLKNKLYFGLRGKI